jgi:Tol biopolymer transport system component
MMIDQFNFPAGSSAPQTDNHILRHAAMLALLLSVPFAACDSGGTGENGAILFPAPNTEPLRFGPPIWHPDGDLWMVHHTPFDENGASIDSLAGVYTLRPDGSDLQPFIICGTFCAFEIQEWAPSGDWVIASGLGWRNGRLLRIEYPTGAISDISGVDQHHRSLPALSPDGHLVAYRRGYGGDWALMTMNIDGTDHRLVREIEHGFRGLTWAPGSDVLTISMRSVDTNGETSYSIAQIYIDTGILEVVIESSANPAWRILSETQFAPNQAALLYNLGVGGGNERQVWRLNLSSSVHMRLADIAMGARWSPDGNQVSYTRYSHRTADFPGYGEIWLMNSDGSNKRQITQP